MLKIYIARHGQNEDNANGILNGHRDLPLTEIGRQQAQKLAAGSNEEGCSLDCIYSSQLTRTYVPAATVHNPPRPPTPTSLPSIIERDFGVMTGKLVGDIEKYCGSDIVKTNTITYFLSPEGAETFPILLERGKRALAEVQEKHSGGSVLLVTHGDIGKMLYTAYYKLPWMDILTMFHFGNSELLLLAHDSKAEDAHIIHIEQHNH